MSERRSVLEMPPLAGESLKPFKAFPLRSEADLELNEGQLLDINMQQFRGRLVLEARRLLYHSTLGLSVIQKQKKGPGAVRPKAMFRSAWLASAAERIWHT